MNKEFLKMQKMAGLITENQMREMMDNDEKVPLTPDVEKYIDDAIDELRKSLPDKEWAKLDGAGFWESEFPESVWMHFEDEFPKALDVSQEVKDHIESKVYGTAKNQVKEVMDDDKFDIIDKLVDKDLYNNFINAVEAIQNATLGKKGIEPNHVYDYLIASMERDA